MIFGVGIDIVEISRIKRLMENTRFLERCFTKREREYFKARKMRAEVVAGSFAAKEALSKALGSGVRGFNLADIEVLRDGRGAPYISFEKGTGLKFSLSISHCKQYATAFVIAERIEEN